jgi:hypothetical protein
MSVSRGVHNNKKLIMTRIELGVDYDPDLGSDHTRTGTKGSKLRNTKASDDGSKLTSLAEPIVVVCYQGKKIPLPADRT